MKISFFPTQADFRKWLKENHDKKSEIIVGYYKISSGKLSMIWSESVDQALCFGWIDCVRRKIDEESYAIRFTPRKAKSIWSAVNIAKVKELSEKGLMKPAGIAAFEKREEKKSKIYAYEQKEASKLSAEFEEQFKRHEKGWEFFENQAKWYKKQMIHWVMSAKQQSTRENRLEKLIGESVAGKRI